MEVCVTNLPASATRLAEYQTTQARDHICSSVIRYCREGWPEKRDVEPDLRPYWKVRGELTVDKDNLLLYGKCIVVKTPPEEDTGEDSRWTPGNTEMPTPSKHSSLVARTLSSSGEHGETVPNMCQRLRPSKGTNDPC